MTDADEFRRVLFSIEHSPEGLVYCMDESLTTDQLLMLEAALRHATVMTGELVAEAFQSRGGRS